MSSRLNESGSFRDPSSQVWVEDGQVFRDIYPGYFEDYVLLMKSGLYNELVGRGLLLPHQEMERTENRIVLQPQMVPFITYPYEWCFSQLKRAALVTLEANQVALEYNMILKDASAFNVQYVNGNWKLIDTASFMKYEEGTPWKAYPQFIRHFLVPLVMCHYRGPQYLKMLLSNIDGLPPVDMCEGLPIKSFLNSGCVTFLHSFRVFRNANHKELRLKKEYLKILLKKLSRYIGSLKGKQNNANYTPDLDYAKAKCQVVSQFLNGKGLVGDLGANTGLYSRIASEQGREVVAIDKDHNCVEKIAHRDNILGLVVDLNNPTPAIGWGNQERKSFLERARFQTTLALALIHHLCIGNNVPLPKVAEQVRKITLGDLIIEFIPETDEKVKALAEGRIFPEYSQELFEKSFNAYFHLKGKRPIGASCRELYIYSIS